MLIVNKYIRDRTYAPEVEHHSLASIVFRQAEDLCIYGRSGEIRQPSLRPWFERKGSVASHELNRRDQGIVLPSDDNQHILVLIKTCPYVYGSAASDGYILSV